MKTFRQNRIFLAAGLLSATVLTHSCARGDADDEGGDVASGAAASGAGAGGGGGGSATGAGSAGIVGEIEGLASMDAPPELIPEDAASLYGQEVGFFGRNGVLIATAVCEAGFSPDKTFRFKVPASAIEHCTVSPLTGKPLSCDLHFRADRDLTTDGSRLGAAVGVGIEVCAMFGGMCGELPPNLPILRFQPLRYVDGQVLIKDAQEHGGVKVSEREFNEIFVFSDAAGNFHLPVYRQNRDYAFLEFRKEGYETLDPPHVDLGAFGTTTVLRDPALLIPISPLSEAEAAMCARLAATREFSGEAFDEAPSIADCRPGLPSAALEEYAIARLNLLREFHGLAPVTFDAASLPSAQAAALLAAANDDPQAIVPPSFAQCYSSAANHAGRTSALIVDSPENISDPATLWSDVIADFQWTSAARTRVLCPSLTATAFGGVADTLIAGAFKLGGATNAAALAGATVALPAATMYPYRTAGRTLGEIWWSFSRAGMAIGASTVRVTDETTGGEIPVHVVGESSAECLPTVVYSVERQGVRPRHTLRIDVNGHSYRTRLIDCP